MPNDRVLVPISVLFADVFPAEWLTPVDDALSSVAVDMASAEFEWDTTGLWVNLHCYVIEPAGVDLPLLPGFRAHLGRPGQNPNFWFRGSSDPVGVAELEDVDVDLETSPDVVSAWEDDAGTWEVVENDSGDPIGFTVGLSMNAEADVTGHTDVDVESGLDVPYAGMIADTGFLFDLSTDESEQPHFVLGDPPADIEDDLPDGFDGLWLPRVNVHYVGSGGTTSHDIPALEISQAAIGTGGFSGRVSIDGELPDSLTDHFTSDGGALDPDQRGTIRSTSELFLGEIGGFTVVLHSVSISFDQSVPAGSSLQGYAFLPLVERWNAFEVALGGPEGDFMLDVGGGGEADLVSLENDWVEIEADSISYVTEDGVHYAVVDGSIRPKLPGFDWPTMEVEGLRVSSEGDVELPGGWLSLPETVTLDLFGFKLDISELGLGTTENPDGTNKRWFGFTGGIRLVEGVPLSSSVEGLRFAWPADKDPEGNLEVTLEGVGVHLEIPEVLILDGSVAYRELPADDERGPADVFQGSVDVDVPPLKLAAGADFMVAPLKRPGNGGEATALYVVIDVGFPSPIPLGSSGTGVHGIGALFGMHVGPDRGDKSWFNWYKEPAPGDASGSSAYDITTVKKWRPELDNWAFGGGLTLGTLFDDGTVLNLGVFAVVLIPGPVVMVEGKANLLKPIPEQPAQSGAFTALAVFDGRANTFQVNVEAAYDLAKVVAVTGSVEAFFNFADSSDWHVYLGQKTPKSKRIAASILSLFDVNLYLMIGGDAIKTGAHARFDFRESYGPVAVSLLAHLGFDAEIFWKPKQLKGKIVFEAELGIEVFGIGLGLLLKMLLEAKTPSPFWVHGLAKVKLSLPWPLPDPQFQIEFTWEDKEPPAAVSPFLKGASARHHKHSGGGWELGDAPDSAPVVPVDSRAVLSFARPILHRSGQLLDNGELDPFPPDQVDEWEFAYEYDQVEITAKESGETVVQYRPPSDISGIQPVDTSPESLKPGPDAQEPDWELWEHGPLDTAPLRRRETYTDTYSPCKRDGTPTCVDWDEVAPGIRYPNAFEYRGLSFIVGADGGRPTVRTDSLECPPTEDEWGHSVYLRFPEPVGDASLTARMGEGLLDEDNVTLFSGGRKVVDPPTREGAGSFELAFSGTPDDPLEFDAIHIQTRPGAVAPSSIYLEEICYRTTRELEAERNRDAGREDDRTPSGGAPVLEPDMEYELTVGTKTTISKGDEQKDSREETSTFHFRTGTGPGTNESDIAFADTPLDDLATYIDHTLPAHGARQAYYGYDLAVGFNEGYVERMYDGSLGLRVRDRNGTLIADPGGEHFEGDLPLLPPGLLTRQAAEKRQCQSTRPADLTRRPYFGRSAPRSDGERVLRPNRTYTAEVVTRVDEGDETLYSFQFNTSEFPDLEAHLRSGLVEDDGDERQTSHTLPSVPEEFDPSWTDDDDPWTDKYDTRRERVETLRTDLNGKLDDVDDSDKTGLSTDIADLLVETKRAIDDLDERNEEWFETLDGPLDDRPLPPVLEFIQIPVEDNGPYALLVESPEPLAWHRLELTCDAGDVRVVWNGDKTRAFVLVGPDLWLDPDADAYEFTFSYGSEIAPELPPLRQDSSPVNDDVHCTLKVTNE